MSGHILDTLLTYYQAWLRAKRPEHAVQFSIGPMMPYAKGEKVCPPDAPVKATSVPITTIIKDCDSGMLEQALTKSGCTLEVVQVWRKPSCPSALVSRYQCTGVLLPDALRSHMCSQVGPFGYTPK